MFKPLKDITVLDLTQVLAGPFGSYQLSFLGAKIIKIENGNAVIVGNYENDFS